MKKYLKEKKCLLLRADTGFFQGARIIDAFGKIFWSPPCPALKKTLPPVVYGIDEKCN